MFTVNSSVASILERIICKIEVETTSDKEISRFATKRKLDDIGMSSKKSKRARYETVGVEEIHCRICYDSNQQFPIVYPCKCKVGSYKCHDTFDMPIRDDKEYNIHILSYITYIYKICTKCPVSLPIFAN